jgi:predicted transcriptional regulator
MGRDGGAGPGQRYENAVFGAKVSAAIRLVERESEFMDFMVYRMRVFDGASGKKVAEDLGVSEPTVSRRLSRIRERLRTRLGEVITRYSFTEDELDEASRKGLELNPTKADDALFDEALAEIYHTQIEQVREETVD